MEIKLQYFNSVFNVDITTDRELVKDFTHKKRVPGGIFRLTAYKPIEGLRFYTFGIMLDDPHERPGHGGEWSSNGDAVRKEFGVDTIPVGINHFAYHVSAEDLLKRLPTYRRYRYSLANDNIKHPVHNAYYDPEGNLITKKRFRLSKVSMLSGKRHEMIINCDPKLYHQWNNIPAKQKPHVQDAFPMLPKDQREFILTGITPNEWSETFPAEQQDDMSDYVEGIY